MIKTIVGYLLPIRMCKISIIGTGCWKIDLLQEQPQLVAKRGLQTFEAALKGWPKILA